MLILFFKRFSNFIAAICVPLLAFAIQYQLWEFLAPFVWILFYPAIFISSRIGSFKSGVIATLLSAGIVWFFFLTPQHSFEIENLNNIFSMLVFVLVGLLLSNLHMQLRKAGSRVLVDAENKYKYVLENMLEGCQIINKNWEYVYINASAESHNRIKRENLIGRRFMDMWPEIDKTIVFQEMKKCMNERTSSYFVNEFIFPDKTIGWFEISIYPVPEGIFIHSVDITARKKVEVSMLKTQQELKKAQQIAGIGYWILNLRDFQMEWSDEMFVLFCLEREKFTGNLDDVVSQSIHVDDRDKVNTTIMSVLSTGESVSVEFRVVWPDGAIHYMWTEVSTLECDDANNPYMLNGIVQDITQRKLNEKEILSVKNQAEESNRLKTVFLANMSHEIRTPLNAICGFSNLLVNSDLDSSKRDFFTKMIQQRSLDLLHIVDDILDISKIEAGQMNVKYELVSISKLLNELLVFYQEQLKTNIAKSNVALKLSIPDGLQRIKILTDSFRFKQIISNLIDNAIKFTPEGLVEFGVINKSNSEITFYVKDTGIGIEQKYHSHIFDRFKQVDEINAQKNYGGSGLGLSIVKGMLEIFNSTIQLDSELGRGSNFYFDYPLEQDELKSNSDSNIVANTKNWNDKTILIVEDDKMNALFLLELLRDTNVKLLFAFNGKQALEVFNLNKEISLVLMDIRLPDASGLDLTRHMKSKNPDIKIIAQSAYSSSSDITSCYDAGCDSYMSKPINVTQFLDIIDRNL